MNHTGPAALDALEALLVELRGIAGIKERSRGVFYLRSKPVLHFHEDQTGIHADLRIDGDFVRFRAETKAERRALLAQARQILGGTPAPKRESEKTKAGS